MIRTHLIVGRISPRLAVGDKTADEVKRHYEILVEDVKRIENGKVPFPMYRTTGGSSQVSMHDNEER